MGYEISHRFERCTKRNSYIVSPMLNLVRTTQGLAKYGKHAEKIVFSIGNCEIYDYYKFLVYIYIFIFIICVITSYTVARISQNKKLIKIIYFIQHPLITIEYKLILSKTILWTVIGSGVPIVTTCERIYQLLILATQNSLAKVLNLMKKETKPKQKK